MVMTKEVKLLSDIAAAFTDSLDLEMTLKSIMQLLDAHIRLERGTIALLDADAGTIAIKIAHGTSAQSQEKSTYKIGEDIAGQVVRTGKEIIVPDISNDPRFVNEIQSGCQTKSQKIAFFCVPVILEGNTIGYLSVGREIQKGDGLDDIVKLLNTIATMVAQAVKLNRLFETERKKLRDENVHLRQEIKSKFNINNMIGKSNAVKKVYRLIEQVADSTATVLINGESGTGKDLVAHAVHYNSLRSDKPFIKVNCTALPDTLLESELFGHEKGSFTGAIERKIGRFERAHGGTIFLDEIGDFSLNLQVKLLRIIQFKEFERVGGYDTIKTNVRIIVATNKNLERLIREGLFREDLYYRINVFPIYLPPLRDKKDDIMLLADSFLEKLSKNNNKNISRISTPAIEMLTSYHWPGNVRELENCIERAVLMCDGDTIRSEHLPPSLQIAHCGNSSSAATMAEIIANKEKELIIDALKKSGGQQRQAAKELGITERILGYKIKKYQILPKLLS